MTGNLSHIISGLCFFASSSLAGKWTPDPDTGMCDLQVRKLSVHVPTHRGPKRLDDYCMPATDVRETGNPRNGSADRWSADLE